MAPTCGPSSIRARKNFEWAGAKALGNPAALGRDYPLKAAANVPPGGKPMAATLNALALVGTTCLLLVAPHSAGAQAPEKRKINVATASLGLPYLPLIIAQQ